MDAVMLDPEAAVTPPEAATASSLHPAPALPAVADAVIRDQGTMLPQPMPATSSAKEVLIHVGKLKGWLQLHSEPLEVVCISRCCKHHGRQPWSYFGFLEHAQISREQLRTHRQTVKVMWCKKRLKLKTFLRMTGVKSSSLDGRSHQGVKAFSTIQRKRGRRPKALNIQAVPKSPTKNVARALAAEFEVHRTKATGRRAVSPVAKERQALMQYGGDELWEGACDTADDAQPFRPHAPRTDGYDAQRRQDADNEFPQVTGTGAAFGVIAEFQKLMQ